MDNVEPEFEEFIIQKILTESCVNLLFGNYVNSIFRIISNALHLIFIMI